MYQLIEIYVEKEVAMKLLILLAMIALLSALIWLLFLADTNNSYALGTIDTNCSYKNIANLEIRSSLPKTGLFYKKAKQINTLPSNTSFKFKKVRTVKLIGGIIQKWGFIDQDGYQGWILIDHKIMITKDK